MILSKFYQRPLKKDLCEASFVFGIKTHRAIFVEGLSQNAYIDHVFKRYNMHSSSPEDASSLKVTSSLTLSPKNELEKEA